MGLGATSWKKVTIASAAALSSALDIQGYQVIGLAHRANVEGVSYTADVPAPRTLQEGVAEVYVPLYRDIREATGAAPITARWEVSKSATLEQVIMLDPVDYIRGPSRVKFSTTDASLSDATQNANEDIWVLLEEIGHNA